MSRRDGAILAWHEVPGTAPPQKGRPVGVRSDSRIQRWYLAGTIHYTEQQPEHHRTRTFQEEYLVFLKKRHTFRRETPLGLAAPDHTVPCGTVLSRDAFPGTSCQATIGAVPTGRAGRHFVTASSVVNDKLVV